MSAQCNGKSRCVKGRRVALQMQGATVRRYTPSGAFATQGSYGPHSEGFLFPWTLTSGAYQVQSNAILLVGLRHDLIAIRCLCGGA
jgi:hypothetical protein